MNWLIDQPSWADVLSLTSDGAVVGRPGPLNFRVDVVRQTNDLYHWALLASPSWKPVFGLDYHRIAEGSAGAGRR